jgi:hypothetical protein
MIARPTTDVLVRDCCRELLDGVLPGIADDTVKLRLIMAVTVLENTAVRAAHEIAWMRAEIATALEYAEQVAACRPDDGLAAALAEVDAGPHDSLHLHDVVDVYERVGRALDVAVQVAFEAASDDLVNRGATLLRDRVDTEKTVMATYAIVGR